MKQLLPYMLASLTLTRQSVRGNKRLKGQNVQKAAEIVNREAYEEAQKKTYKESQNYILGDCGCSGIWLLAVGDVFPSPKLSVNLITRPGPLSLLLALQLPTTRTANS